MQSTTQTALERNFDSREYLRTWTGNQPTQYLEIKQPLIRPHQDIKTNHIAYALRINPTIVQPAPARILFWISSSQHNPHLNPANF